MTPAFIIIGWLVCGVLCSVLYARKEGELNLAQAILILCFAPAIPFLLLCMYGEETVVWRRKPDDQSREEL